MSIKILFHNIEHFRTTKYILKVNKRLKQDSILTEKIVVPRKFPKTLFNNWLFLLWKEKYGINKAIGK